MTSIQKWIIGGLVLFSMAVSGYVIGQIKEVNTDLQNYKMMSARDAVSLAKEQVVMSGQMAKEYVLKEDFKCEISELKKQLGKMDDKLDKLMRK